MEAGPRPPGGGVQDRSSAPISAQLAFSFRGVKRGLLSQTIKAGTSKQKTFSI